ncbi:hypothetical protein [Halorussus salinisoli]|uniref:hypothetical protein n=1 Tax=Halorussus salinisoli TaxID=2558242 RepID=UPI0010C240E0|nr:hypothetical protein [Halorussus salinisoli]
MSDEIDEGLAVIGGLALFFALAVGGYILLKAVVSFALAVGGYILLKAVVSFALAVGGYILLKAVVSFALAVGGYILLKAVVSFALANILLVPVVVVVGGFVGVMAYSEPFREAYTTTAVVVGHVALVGYSLFQYAECTANPSCWTPGFKLLAPTGVLVGVTAVTLCWLGARHVRQSAGRGY